MKDRFFFIDMVCLFDRTYAGIANVNYQIAKYFYQHHKESTCFFHQDQIVRPEAIEVLLRRRDGLGLQEFSQTGKMYVQPLNDLLRQIKGRTVGIYPYLKPFHEKFDYEIQVIYDLTILLTPEFHHPETLKSHIPSWERDIRTNHLCVCISHSTQEDLVHYLGFPQEKTLVSHLGCEPELRHDPVYKSLLQRFKNRVEKFILILGTVEPRKNIQSILTFLEGNPGVLNRYKFVFIGRDGGKDGWGETFRQKLAKLRIDEKVKSHKIIFLEYVSEEEKNILLMTADFLIYPSIYEGFGLPVLESLNLGCPVLASMSSSIPEVGEKAIDYFDPYDVKSFEDGFHRIAGRLEEDRENVVHQCIYQASQFTWNNFFDRILRRVDQDLGETQQIKTTNQPVFVEMPRPLKVLVLKLDHRGDFLFSIPAIMKLKDKLKNVDLDIIVGEWNVGLAKKLNVFQNIYSFNFFDFFGSKPSDSTATKVRKEKKLLNQLSHYDLAVDFRRPPETRSLLARVPADLKIGYKSFSAYDQSLDIVLDTEIDQPGIWIEDNKRNVSLQLLKLVDAIPFYGVYLPSLAPYQPEGRQIGMFPGAGEESRQWPVEFFVKVAGESIGLRMAEKINIYLAPYEQKLAEPFSAFPQVKIFIGLELDEMLQSLTRNRLVLTNNSFGAHICSYLGIPSIAIYSGVEPTREWAPPFGSVTVVYSDLSCVPCHGVAEHCPNQLICLKRITPEYILDLMKKRMREQVECNRNEYYLYCPDPDSNENIVKFIESFSNLSSLP